MKIVTASFPMSVGQGALRSASVIDGREPLEEVESLSRAVLMCAVCCAGFVTKLSRRCQQCPHVSTVPCFREAHSLFGLNPTDNDVEMWRNQQSLSCPHPSSFTLVSKCF